MRLRLADNTELSVKLPSKNCASVEVLHCCLSRSSRMPLSTASAIHSHRLYTLTSRSTTLDRSVCRIENSRFSKGTNDKSGSGIGLDNLKKRLDILYPDRYTFIIQEDEYSYRSELTLSTHPQ